MKAGRSRSICEYLRSVKNSSPHTILNYRKDLEQFLAYLVAAGSAAASAHRRHAQIIREFVGHLHDHGLEKSSIARKLAALRSFFKYCVREGLAEGESGAACAHAETAEAHSVGAFRGRNEWFPQSACGMGIARRR